MIRLTLLDNTKKELELFDEITENDNILEIDCMVPGTIDRWTREDKYSNFRLQLLPENMNFPNLQKFNCDHNKLTFLPDMNFPNLKYFDCRYNQLSSLPAFGTKGAFGTIINFSNLKSFNCSDNKLTLLPDNMNLPNLEKFYCSNNQLTLLPNNMNFPNLQRLIVAYNQLTSLPNMHFPNLQRLDCSRNQLTSLPAFGTMNFPNLQRLHCKQNELTSLPENMNFPNLEGFDCSENKLTLLSENMNFPNIQYFFCKHNQLISLPDMHFPNLRSFECEYNKLTSLTDNMNFPNLENFDCSHNQITLLPNNMIFPYLHHFECSHNKLTSLPLCILNWRNIRGMNIYNNPIELSPQIARFINRYRARLFNDLRAGLYNGLYNELNVYNDTQNVHNSTIQTSVKDSINNITTRTDLLKYDKDELHKLIINDNILTQLCKEQLIEYCSDTTEHSLLLLTFSEVLWFVLQTIHNDFSIEVQNEIKKILNDEMKESECKCFTGRMNRSVNCLNGFSSLVKINIQDSEQIGNVIFLVKDKLEKEGRYIIEMHKEIVSKELKERGYNDDVITEWLRFIE